MVTTELDDVLAQRQKAKAEIDRLRTIIAACDSQIMAVFDAEDDEFARIVHEIRGEVHNYEARKIRWIDERGDTYTVSRRKAGEPRKTIRAEKLLEQGVPAHVIQKATTLGKATAPGVIVRKVVGGIEDDGED